MKFPFPLDHSSTAENFLCAQRKANLHSKTHPFSNMKGANSTLQASKSFIVLQCTSCLQLSFPSKVIYLKLRKVFLPR